jgi:hypothetical protein
MGTEDATEQVAASLGEPLVRVADRLLTEIELGERGVEFAGCLWFSSMTTQGSSAVMQELCPPGH